MLSETLPGAHTPPGDEARKVKWTVPQPAGTPPDVEQVAKVQDRIDLPLNDGIAEGEMESPFLRLAVRKLAEDSNWISSLIPLHSPLHSSVQVIERLVSGSFNEALERRDQEPVEDHIVVKVGLPVPCTFQQVDVFAFEEEAHPGLALPSEFTTWFDHHQQRPESPLPVSFRLVMQPEPLADTDLTAGLFQHRIPFRIGGQIDKYIPHGIGTRVDVYLGMYFFPEKPTHHLFRPPPRFYPLLDGKHQVGEDLDKEVRGAGWEGVVQGFATLAGSSSWTP